ncbi:MAG: hypothetical protein IJV26_07200 [Lachnospiraceae bacterium]|nr:hypothetical protein [Lachnospiraceae bacterium]
MNPRTDKIRLSIQDLAVMGMMLAALEAVKRALDFLPNVELVTLLFIVFTLYYGRKMLLVALAFTLLETFFWGVHNWVIMYLYIWPLLILIVHYTRKHAGHFFYCILSAAYGLLFGAMCSLPYLVAGGPGAAFAWWIAGIPYDIIHCISNFLLCLILYRPLTAALDKVKKSEEAS